MRQICSADELGNCYIALRIKAKGHLITHSYQVQWCMQFTITGFLVISEIKDETTCRLSAK